MGESRGELTTVRFFEELYAVVVGLGLAVAVEQVIDLERAGVPLRAEHALVFLAYLTMAFALAHSSVRYLELAYADRLIGAPTKSRVIGDLVLGVGHFLWLIGLSFLVTRPTAFALGAILLLLGRPTRDAAIALGGGRPLVFDRKVARIHLIAAAGYAVVLIASLLLAGDTELWVMRVTILVTSLVFGLGLYLSAFEFFFPTQEAAP